MRDFPSGGAAANIQVYWILDVREGQEDGPVNYASFCPTASSPAALYASWPPSM